MSEITFNTCKWRIGLNFTVQYFMFYIHPESLELFGLEGLRIVKIRNGKNFNTKIDKSIIIIIIEFILSQQKYAINECKVTLKNKHANIVEMLQESR